MKSRDSILRLKRFQVDEHRKKVGQIELMIEEFRRMIVELDNQIQYEQEKSGISDVTHFAYPTFAKAARDRRENLQTSIDDLQVQLDTAQEAFSEAVEELKKVELLAERDNAAEAAADQAAEQERLDEVAARGFRKANLR